MYWCWYTVGMVQTPFLDILDAATSVDKDNLHRILAAFPDQLEAAHKAMAKMALPDSFRHCRQVVFCGMGGSGIGGELAAEVLPTQARKPVAVVHDYHLPAYVGPDTVVAVVSYSGTTEEAISCFHEALERRAGVMVVTSGGPLLKLAQQAKVPLYHFTYAAPPRDSLGYLFVPLLNVLAAAGVLEPSEINLKPAIKLARTEVASFLPSVPTATNPAKTLAFRLYDHVPIVVGAQLTQAVARRWKDQLNEHSKSAAWFDAFPELNHNTVEGFTWPARWHEDALMVLLRTKFDDAQVAKRFDLFMEWLQERPVLHEVITAHGEDVWSQKLSLLILGDWVSYYLALLYRTDPSAIAVINELKTKLRA